MSTACKLHAYTSEGLVRNIFLEDLPAEIVQAILADVYEQEENQLIILNEGEEYDDECEGTE